MSGYITDTQYPSDFIEKQAPVWLNLMASINGHNGLPVRGEFTYCDLGCGNGFTLLVLAACYPQASFVGVDINEEHIASAEAVRQKSGLENVSFHCIDFRGAVELELPEFDYVCATGIYSWISEEVRQDMHAFVNKFLKKDGVFVVHYVPMPSGAAIPALWRVMREYSADDGASVDRAKKAQGMIERFEQVDAGFFRAFPDVKKKSEGLKQQSPEYVAHETLNEHWHAYYHCDLSKEFKALGCTYLGSAHVRRNFEEHFLTPAALSFVNEATSEMMREMLIDYISMPKIRHDMFIKNNDFVRKRSSQDDVVFGIDSVERELSNTFSFGGGKTVSYESSLYKNLYKYIDKYTGSLLTIGESERFPEYEVNVLEDALHMLLLGGEIRPFVESAVMDVRLDDDLPTLIVTNSYNKAMLKPENWTRDHLVLASTVAGSGIKVPWADAVFLSVLLAGSKDINEGLEIALDNEFIKASCPSVSDKSVMIMLFNIFKSRRLGRYLQLGIVELVDKH